MLQGHSFQQVTSWLLQNHGDLWKMFHYVAGSKGPSSIRVSWTKEHVTDDDVRAGKDSVFQKVGNDLADGVADDGVTEHVGVLRVLSSVWARLQAEYCVFPLDLHK